MLVLGKGIMIVIASRFLRGTQWRIAGRGKDRNRGEI